ncbi:hypothetical protein FDI24_gp079 [Acidovorax phage ACP17]|uniref:Uncharacterized protein n=1 Tax=Acidovorax phage ACP17 TaxID=2010329 RepID=A0A223AJ08_9CAUD|nr:hypothetical protein FDI24_gp079 [Acidovorax phage ACP17]ASS33938.1 hypothetical protein [Acidovorax phage ACP17]
MTNPISPVQRGRLPAFVRSEYPAFEAYMMKYFEWLGRDDNFIGIIQSWKANTDASNEVEPYVDAILRDLGWTWTGDIAVSKTVLLSTLKDFYLSRGTKKSFSWLFHTLFNQPVTISYPRDRMLVTSSADYATNSRIFFTATQRATQAFAEILEAAARRDNVEVVGLASGTTASIESVQILLSGGNAYVQAEISAPLTDFIVREDVRLQAGSDFVIESLLNVLVLEVDGAGSLHEPLDAVTVTGAGLQGIVRVSSVKGGTVDGVTIASAGTGYAVGDKIIADQVSDGFGFFATVSTVGSAGEITGVNVSNRGRGYKVLPELIVKSTAGTGAALIATTTSIGAVQRLAVLQPYVDFDVNAVTASLGNASLICKETTVFSSRDYRDRRGVLSENSTLTDSNRFQQFSYDVASAVPSKYHAEIVDELLHPVGYVRTNVLDIAEAAERSAQKSASQEIQAVEAEDYIVTLSGVSIVTQNSLSNLVTL